MIEDSFTAGSQVGPEYMIPTMPPLVTSMRAISSDVAAKSAGIDSLVGVNGGLQLQMAYRVESGSLLALHGKVFRVAQIRRDPGTGRTSVDFAAVGDEELNSAISRAADTLFIPIGCNGQIRQARFTVAAAPEVAGDKQPAVVFRFKPPSASDRSPVQLAEAQREQRIQAGDVVRYGAFGLQVRKIVPPNPEKKLSGWVEVLNTESVFDAK